MDRQPLDGVAARRLPAKLVNFSGDRGWMRTGPCADCSFWRYCEGNGFHLRDSSGRLMHCHLLKDTDLQT